MLENNILDICLANNIELFPRKGFYKATCPFHTEKTPSFSIDPLKNTYRCFSCGAAGDADKFIEEMQKIVSKNNI